MNSLMSYVISLGLLFSSLLIPQDNAGKAARAQELLAQARKAMGAEKVKSLTAAGNARQLLGDREMSGEIELNIMAPDKFLKTTTLEVMGGMELTRIEAISGDNAWTDSKTGGGGGGHMVVRMGGPGGNTSSADQQKAQQIFVRQEWSRVMLGFPVLIPASMGLEFSYAGEAEAPDGLAHVIDIKGQAGFTAQLFIDQKTSLPLMVMYKGRKPRVVTRMVSSPEEIKGKSPEEALKEAQAKAAAEPPVDIQIRFMNYKTEGGVMIPQHVTRTIDGQVSEEWQLAKFKINPALKADIFEKK
ncbi:MAG: hypothetical protein ACKV2V_12715 [Blastocatellia bacterium]